MRFARVDRLNWKVVVEVPGQLESAVASMETPHWETHHLSTRFPYFALSVEAPTTAK